MRLFVSINLKDEVLEEVRQLQQQLCAREDMRIRPARHVHITLGFIGEVESANASRIAQALCNLTFSPFEVSLAKLGFFGARRQPRVIWLGVEPREPLIELHSKVKEALKQVPNADFSKGDFEPHITLARIKQVYAPQTPVAAIYAMPVSKLKVSVESFSLMQSTMQPSGAIYTELGYYPAK